MFINEDLTPTRTALLMEAKELAGNRWLHRAWPSDEEVNGREHLKILKLTKQLPPEDENLRGRGRGGRGGRRSRGTRGGRGSRPFPNRPLVNKPSSSNSNASDQSATQ